LSEGYAANDDCSVEYVGAWVCSLVCRLNQPMRLTEDQLNSHFNLIDRSSAAQAGQPPFDETLALEALNEPLAERKTAPEGLSFLQEILTPRELMTLREMASLRGVAALCDVATPLEMASLRDLRKQGNPQLLRGLEMRGWLAAPLTSREGHNLGLIQLSD